MSTIYYTVQQAAAKLGISPRRVRKIAERLGVGFRPNSRLLLLAERDISKVDKSRRPVGNPNFGRKKPGRKPKPANDL